MVDVQRARDAQMAHSLIAAGDPGGAILVAGAGHVRADYGIPVYIRVKAPEKRVISISFIEVDKQKITRRVTRYAPMADCLLITFGSRHGSSAAWLL
jgi:uncharacterized iron-regulated protein